MLRRILVAVGLVLALVVGIRIGARAAEKKAIDSTPPESILVNLDGFYAQHALQPGEPTRADKVFSSPRCVVNLVSNKGPLIGRHIHTSCDEIVFVYKGSGEMYINDKWIPVKAGDLHVCPSGVAHATRVVGEGIMEVISIFTPPQAGGNDRIMLDQ